MQAALVRKNVMLNLLAPVEVVDFPLAFLRFGDTPAVIADTAYSDGVAGQTKVLQELWNFSGFHG
jgi:hypothetical protein